MSFTLMLKLLPNKSCESEIILWKLNSSSETRSRPAPLITNYKLTLLISFAKVNVPQHFTNLLKLNVFHDWLIPSVLHPQTHFEIKPLCWSICYHCRSQVFQNKQGFLQSPASCSLPTFTRLHSAEGKICRPCTLVEQQRCWKQHWNLLSLFVSFVLIKNYKSGTAQSLSTKTSC